MGPRLKDRIAIITGAGCVGPGWGNGRSTAVRFAEEFCLIGTAAQITQRLRTLRDLGVTDVFLQHVGSYDLPTDLIETVGASVLPALRRG